MSTTLFVGALLAEVLPLLRQLENPVVLNHRLVEGSLQGSRIFVLRCGVGPKAAYENTMNTLKQWNADRVLSIGTCGALQDHLSIGDICTSDTIHSEAGLITAIEPLPEGSTEPLITVQKPVFTQERRQLFATRASICEMEAFSVWKASDGRVFHTLKVVSDHAGRDADPVMSHSIVKAHRIAAFMLRAGSLSRQFLVPAILSLYER